MQSGGINLYVKLVLMTAKIKFYFWKKKGFVTLCIKKCENLIILRTTYIEVLSLLCVYVQYVNLNSLVVVLFIDFYLESPILRITEGAFIASEWD